MASSTAVLYLSILSNSVLLIVLHQLRTPRPTLQPPQASTQGNPEPLGSSLQFNYIDGRHEAAASQMTPHEGVRLESTPVHVEQPLRPQRRPVPVLVTSDDEDDDHRPPTVIRHVHSHTRPTPRIFRRQATRPARLDLNQPWEEVTLNLDGHEWGIFSLSELVAILLHQYIHPTNRDLLHVTESTVNLTNRVDAIDELVQHVNTAIQGMATQMGTAVHTTTDTAQTVESIRQHSVHSFEELMRRTVEQQRTLAEDARDIRVRLMLVHNNIARIGRRVSNIEDHLGLDDVDAVQHSPSVSDESSVTEEEEQGNGSEVAETVEEGSERSASV